MEIFILTDRDYKLNDIDYNYIKTIKISSIKARDKLLHNKIGICITKLPILIIKLNEKYIFFPYKSLEKLKKAKEPYIENIIIVKEKQGNLMYDTGFSINKTPFMITRINGEYGFS